MFTCLYVHNPDLIEEPALKAFALGILKVCDIAREKVNKAAVFEEVSNVVLSVCHCVCVCVCIYEAAVQLTEDIIYVHMCVEIFEVLLKFLPFLPQATIIQSPYLYVCVGGLPGHDLWLQDGQ